LTWLRDLLREEMEIARETAEERFEAAGHGKKSTFATALKQLGADALITKDGFGGKGMLKWVGQ